jgi:serine/threonine protein kinase
VYLAADELKTMDIALKVVPVESEFTANQLKNEIMLNYRVVDFSHVIRVHDIHSIRYGGIALLLTSMEYANGGSLRKWLHDNRDDIDKRRTIGLAFFKQACLGISALDAVGVVHQDVKPENLLLVDGILKVSDLGLSRCVRGVRMGDNSYRSDNQGHLPSCTPSYAAPEQLFAAHPDDIDHRTDIHALGAILFEIFHHRCRPPFGGTHEQILQHHLHRVPIPALEDVEPHVGGVIAKCLQKDPADRFSSVSELLDALEDRMSETESSQDDTKQEIIEQIEQLWQRACESVREGDLRMANRLCDQILSICPDHGDATSMHEDIQHRYEKAGEFNRIVKASMGYQSLDQLISLMNEAVAIYPEHPDSHLVQVQLSEAVKEYEDVIQKGIEAVSKAQLQTAQINFERAWQLSPGSPVFKRHLDSVNTAIRQIETARNNIDAALAQGREDEAMSLASDLDHYVEEIKNMVR